MMSSSVLCDIFSPVGFGEDTGRRFDPVAFDLLLHHAREMIASVPVNPDNRVVDHDLAFDPDMFRAAPRHRQERLHRYRAEPIAGPDDVLSYSCDLGLFGEAFDH